MWVSVLRHGEAGQARDDFSRNLTSKGCSDVKAAAAMLRSACEARAQLAQPSRIVHSPYERTTQTAQLVQERFVDTALAQSEALVPESSVSGVEAMLLQCKASNEQHIVLASHQPLVSYLLDHFLGSDHPVPPMVPAAMATFSLEIVAANAGQLLCWSVPPLFEPQWQ